MGFKSVAAKFVAAALMVAGSVASAGVAAADPEPSPPPGPTGRAPGPPPAPAPAAKAAMDHDGTYVVGKDIAPGTYSSGGPVGTGTCYWKRMGNPDGNVVDNALTKKPQVVQIEATDKAFKTSGCQPWQSTPGAAPADVPGPVAGAQLQTTLGALNGLLGPTGGRVPGT
jgi:hypothetical protein